jgi:UDP-N-acetylmuramate dehydrogenase
MYLKNIDFSKYSSIKIGQIQEVLILEKNDKIPNDRYLIGGANNLLISPTAPPLMMLGKDYAYISQEDNILEIGASMPTGRIVSYAKKQDISRFEFCAKLPGFLGGLIAMNAGVKEYEIFDILHSIQIDNEWIPKEQIKYGYRFAKLPGIVTAARFEIQKGYDYALEEHLAKLRSNQPSTPSAGSAFKNPPNDSAGRLIDSVGLRGYQKGNMAFSPQHANFLVNLGGGSYQDAIYLLQLAQKRVFEEYGIKLEEEIIIL